jgi:hypothetical protein
MIRPTLSISGSSAADLIQPRRDAMDLINELIDALKQVTPNGRDYICERDRFIDDRTTHFDRLAALRVLREELLEEALHIGNQERVGA